MAANPRNANGHRRRQLRARHLAGAATKTCAWPDCPWPHEPFDRTLHHLDPKAPEVDEIIPVSLGGNPLSWTGTQLLHRWCNRQKSNKVAAPAGAEPPLPPATSRAW